MKDAVNQNKQMNAIHLVPHILPARGYNNENECERPNNEIQDLT